VWPWPPLSPALTEAVTAITILELSDSSSLWLGPLLRVLSDTGGFATSGSEYDVHHDPVPEVGRHGGALH
jgi:hypothetical protein